MCMGSQANRADRRAEQNKQVKIRQHISCVSVFATLVNVPPFPSKTSGHARDTEADSLSNLRGISLTASTHPTLYFPLVSDKR